MFSQRARFSLAKANGLLKRTERQVLQVRDFERFFFAIITGAFYRWSGINLNLVDTLFRVAAERIQVTNWHRPFDWNISFPGKRDV